MTHALDEDFAGEIARPQLNPAFAVYIEQVAGEDVRAWTGIGDLSFGGSTYHGTGSFGALDPSRETVDGSAVGLKVTLDQVPAEMADDVDADGLRGARMDVYALAVDAGWRNVAGQPKRVWRGRVDTVQVIDSGTTLTLILQGENSARSQRKPAIKRYTDAYQQSRYPGDKFFEYLPSLAEVPILWAQASQSAAETSAGGGSGAGGRFADVGPVYQR